MVTVLTRMKSCHKRESWSYYPYMFVYFPSLSYYIFLKSNSILIRGCHNFLFLMILLHFVIWILTICQISTRISANTSISDRISTTNKIIEIIQLQKFRFNLTFLQYLEDLKTRKNASEFKPMVHYSNTMFAKLNFLLITSHSFGNIKLMDFWSGTVLVHRSKR